MPSTVTVHYPFHPLRRQSLEVLVWPRQAHLPVTVRPPAGSTLKIPLWMLDPAAARIDLHHQVELNLPTWRALAALLEAHSVALATRPQRAMPMPTPQQISLDLDDEAPAPVPIPLECKPTLIDLMAQAIVAVWRSAQEVDHEER